MGRAYHALPYGCGGARVAQLHHEADRLDADAGADQYEANHTAYDTG